MSNPEKIERYYRQVLVQVSVAKYVLGLSKRRVLEMVDEGRLRWVFDVSAPSGMFTRRELRFWVGELYAPGRHYESGPEGVVSCIVGHGHEKRLCTRTVCITLDIERPHLGRLSSTGELIVRPDGGLHTVARADLCGFLLRRLVH